MRVLVVEDDAAIRRFLQRGLEAEHFQVDACARGSEALSRAEPGAFDVVVLDLNLPDIDGLEVARTLRADHITMPIIMLTGRTELPDRLAGFAAGADDYLAKPFALKELVARIHAVTSRTGQSLQADKLGAGEVTLDRSAHEVTVAGKQVTLTPKEFAVLEYLMDNPGRVLTREAILARVWDYTFDPFSNVVDTVIRRLRKALGGDEDLIETVRGVGYKIRS